MIEKLLALAPKSTNRQLHFFVPFNFGVYSFLYMLQTLMKIQNTSTWTIQNLCGRLSEILSKEFETLSYKQTTVSSVHACLTNSTSRILTSMSTSTAFRERLATTDTFACWTLIMPSPRGAHQRTFGEAMSRVTVLTIASMPTNSIRQSQNERSCVTSVDKEKPGKRLKPNVRVYSSWIHLNLGRT